MQIKLIVIIVLVIRSLQAFSQQPKYAPRYLVSYEDPSLVKPVGPKGNGVIKTYLVANPEVWDIDDNNTTHMRGTSKALICIEGQYENGKRNGLFSSYLVDSFDHSKRHKHMGSGICER